MSLRCLRAALLVAVVCALVVGCAGRSEFRRGQELLAQGEHRQAYHQFWEAASQRPTSEYLSSLREVGNVVAEEERRAGLARAARGDLQSALRHFALALEYQVDSLLAAEDYARVWRLQATREAGLEVYPGSGSLLADKRFKRLLKGVGEIEAVPGDVDAGLRSALDTDLREAFEALRQETWTEPLPADPSALARLAEQWQQAILWLDEQAEMEQDLVFSPSAGLSGYAAGAGLARQAYLAQLGEVARALGMLDRAMAGALLLARGQEAESNGDLESAAAMYLQALQAHPTLPEAHSGRRRALARFAQEAYQHAALRAREGDPEGALTWLDRALAAAPGHEGAARLRRALAAELGQSLLLESRRLEDAGLVGCALVKVYLCLAQRQLDPELGAVILRLESALEARAQVRRPLAMGRRSQDDHRLRRDLWAVDEEELLAFERATFLAAQAASGAGSGATGKAHSASIHPEAILLVDLDFAFRQGIDAHGGEEVRHVRRLALRQRACLEALELEVLRAQEELGEALGREVGAAFARHEMAQEEVRLARLQLGQAEMLLAAAREKEPELDWETSRYSTREMITHAEAAALLELQGETWWVTAHIEERDRIVQGDSATSVPTDPGNSVTRGEALRRLAPRLGAAIGVELQRRHQERQADFYRHGLAYLEAHAFDLATENLVLFLSACQASPDEPRCRDAARRLKGLTGCDLPAARAQFRALDASR